MYKVILVMILAADIIFSSACHAGSNDWLTYEEYNEKYVSNKYKLSGGELDSVTGKKVSNGTVDKFKQASRALPYAELSLDVYNKKCSIDNWKRIDDKKGSSGFHAITYQNTKTKEIVIAFEGTDLKSVKDILTDANGGFLPSAQQIQAVNYAAEIIEREGTNIKLTGHSLGGGLAQTAAAVLGLKAVTFNSATVNWSMKGLVAFGQPALGKPNITNYVMKGDLVNPVSTVFGLAGKDYGTNVKIEFDVPKGTSPHSKEFMRDSLQHMSDFYNDVLARAESTNNKITADIISGICQGSNSHIGSPISNMGPAVTNPTNTNNAKVNTKTQYEARGICW